MVDGRQWWLCPVPMTRRNEPRKRGLVFEVGRWAAMVVVARGRLAVVSGGSGGGQRSDNSGIYQWT